MKSDVLTLAAIVFVVGLAVSGFGIMDVFEPEVSAPGGASAGSCDRPALIHRAFKLKQLKINAKSAIQALPSASDRGFLRFRGGKIIVGGRRGFL
ncbi:MAG: hypothetical protein NVV73_16020 [Cellvibrionaceae bacterium]|nr:hypothetical protein [Cellvibrionaceae bacterium]